MAKLRSMGSVLVLILLCSIFSIAQTQITTGVIQGTLVDSSGAVISGASVEVKNPKTNFTKDVTTEADGRFAFLALPPGTYTVKTAKSGFTTLLQKDIELTVGQAINVRSWRSVSAGMREPGGSGTFAS